MTGNWFPLDVQTDFPSSSLSSAKRSKREFRSTHGSLLMIAYRATRSSCSNALAVPIYMHKSIYGPFRWSRSCVRAFISSRPERVWWKHPLGIRIVSIAFTGPYHVVTRLCAVDFIHRYSSTKIREARDAPLRSCRDIVRKCYLIARSAQTGFNRYSPRDRYCYVAIAVREMFTCPRVSLLSFWFFFPIALLRLDSFSRLRCHMRTLITIDYNNNYLSI